MLNIYLFKERKNDEALDDYMIDGAKNYELLEKVEHGIEPQSAAVERKPRWSS